MKVYPAVDLRAGRAVQLVGGVPGTERVTLDAEAAAKHWEDSGFRALHVIDLDAALAQGSNRAILERILASARVPVQVGGGVRTTEDVETLFALGAQRVIAGTRAVLDAGWLEETAQRWPHRIVVAADAREGLVQVSGWTAASGIRIESLLATLSDLPLAGVLVTDVGREGRMQGVDANWFATLAGCTSHELIAAGGVACMADLAALQCAGVAGVVLGMALYTGALDVTTLIREYA